MSFLEKNYQNFIEKLSKMEAEFEVTNNKMSDMNESMQTNLKHIAGLDHRISDFESAIVQNAHHIKALDSRVSSFTNGIYTNANNIGTLNTRQ